MLGGKIPSQATLLTFLAACELTRADVPLWLAAWQKARTSAITPPPGAIRVREARARELGVHAAIQVEGATAPLPAYVRRDVDAKLAGSLRAGGFVLLVGGSSVGKTRSLYEVLRVTLPDWWLFFPSGVDEIDDFARAPVPRTVLWLDDIQRYLAEGLHPATVRRLLGPDSSIVVVGTLWPDRYHEYRRRPGPGERDDSHRHEREIISMAQVLDLAESLSRTERLRAAELAGDDPASGPRSTPATA